MFDNNPKYKKVIADVANFLQNIRESEVEPSEEEEATEEESNEEEE